MKLHRLLNTSSHPNSTKLRNISCSISVTFNDQSFISHFNRSELHKIKCGFLAAKMCREINIGMPKLETSSNPYFSFLNLTLETSLGVLDLSENVCYGAKPSANIFIA